jgi:hypothetical protein
VAATQNKEGLIAQEASTAHQTVGRGTPWANLCLARGPRRRAAESPPRSWARRPLGRVSALLEGLTPLGRVFASLKGTTPPWARLHLARGRLRPRHRTYSSNQGIKCSGTPQALGSKVNPRHAGPLTPLGNHIPALFHQPALCGHPRRCAGRPVSTPQHCAAHSRTASTSYPSKEDGGTLERRTVTCSAPAWDDAVTLG